MSLFAHIKDLQSGQEKSQAIKALIKDQSVTKANLIKFLNDEIKTTNSKTWLDQSNKILKWVHLNYNDPVIETPLPEEKVLVNPLSPKIKTNPTVENEPIAKPIKSKVKNESPTDSKSMMYGFVLGLLFGMGCFGVYLFIYGTGNTQQSFHELEAVYKDKTRYDLLVDIGSLKEINSDLKAKLQDLNSQDKTEFQKLLELSQSTMASTSVLKITKVIQEIGIFKAKYPNSQFVTNIKIQELKLQKVGAQLAIKQLIQDYNLSKSKLTISDIARLNKDIQFNELYFKQHLDSAHYQEIVKTLKTKQSKSKKFEKFELEIASLISSRDFALAKTKLVELQIKNPNDSYLHLKEEILQNELGSKIQFVETCIAKAKKLRVDDEDDGNPYYQLQLMITLIQAGKHTLANELWSDFNKPDNFTFLMNYPETFFKEVVQTMSKLKGQDKLSKILQSCEVAVNKMALDSNGTKVLASLQLIQAYNYLKNDRKVDSLLDALIIKTEFFDVNGLPDLSLQILQTLQKLAKYHSVQVQKILPQMKPETYPTDIALVLMNLSKFQEAFDMIPKYKDIILAKIAIGFAKHSQDQLALQCIDFIVKTEDETKAEIQKLIYTVSNHLSENGKFDASLKLRSKLVKEADGWKTPFLALRVLNQQQYAIHKFQHGDTVQAKGILKSNRAEISKLYFTPQSIKPRTLAVFHLSQAYYDIGEYELSFELLNASLLLLDNVPATKDNLQSLSKVVFFRICLLYQQLLEGLENNKFQLKGVSKSILASRLKTTVVKINRTFSSYNDDFIDVTLDIHKLAMYNLKVGLKVKFEEYMALLENMGDERKLSIASNYWFKTAQAYLISY
ncbi:MAG: hypothetical protein KC646_05040 [Candidatus Cloacimonetes bacterium]|nr:hypothetical protein [Candidatus Cloacimonadota bacterium]